jgi:2-dehydro-3-deoxyglucarate aldolase/4-hydroxy-2-oxoheptanedioate aldolase
MENAIKFKDKLARGQVCLGTNITFRDPTVTEALSGLCDFLWIDMEHNPLSLADVQGHIMATKGSDCCPIVRVPWNDPVLIKPVLDIGAAGIIVPLVQTADDVRRAVAACRYPPDGIRGFGPRRPSNYGQLGGPDFCRTMNETIISIAQIEHIRAVECIDDILGVPGLVSVVIGPNDLSGSMGLMGKPRHPDVLRAIETVIGKARKKGVYVGIGIGEDPDIVTEWIDKGVQWLSMGGDFTLLLRAARQVAGQVREHLANRLRKLPG